MFLTYVSIKDLNVFRITSFNTFTTTYKTSPAVCIEYIVFDTCTVSLKLAKTLLLSKLTLTESTFEVQ